MRRGWVSVALWFAAFTLTVVLAFFQRMTGPTYALRGRSMVNGTETSYSFRRAHGGDGGLPVRLEAAGEAVTGTLVWRRYPTSEAWQEIEMQRSGGFLEAEVPHQPAAGKVEYRVRLRWTGGELTLPEDDSRLVARFRGDVPAGVLIPHILAMFLSMLFATRAFLEVLRGTEPKAVATVLVSMVLLMLGGLLLGPMVQKHAFDAYWTGWPNGTDLTDNKTLVAFLAWLPAAVFALRGRSQRIAIVFGWIVMMGIFLIPHSLHGSEIDWQTEGQAVSESHNRPSG